MSTTSLPRHDAVLAALTRAVEADGRWRWLELACSLARGRGDELSDIDVGVGTVDAADVDGQCRALAEAAGDVLDLLVHGMPGRADDVRRVAAEYRDGVQLDLVVMPADTRPGLPDGSVALVDKDGVLSRPWTPPPALPPDAAQAREWLMLGWWALSDTAKYVRRHSLFEAAERVGEARHLALRLHAAAAGVPYPAYGLTSLLDVDPPQLPEHLDRTYCVPDDPAAVLDAARATAALLRGASAAIGVDTPWADAVEARLASAPAQD